MPAPRRNVAMRSVRVDNGVGKGKLLTLKAAGIPRRLGFVVLVAGPLDAVVGVSPPGVSDEFDNGGFVKLSPPEEENGVVVGVVVNVGVVVVGAEVVVVVDPETPQCSIGPIWCNAGRSGANGPGSEVE